MGLSKNIRLKSAETIARLYQDRKAYRKYPVRLVYHFELADKPEISYAVTAPKRNFKKAVSRNKLKRLLREVVRLHHDQLEKVTIERNIKLEILAIYYGREIESYDKIESSFLLCQSQIIQEIKMYEG